MHVIATCQDQAVAVDQGRYADAAPSLRHPEPQRLPGAVSKQCDAVSSLQVHAAGQRWQRVGGIAEPDQSSTEPDRWVGVGAGDAEAKPCQSPAVAVAHRSTHSQQQAKAAVERCCEYVTLIAVECAPAAVV